MSLDNSDKQDEAPQDSASDGFKGKFNKLKKYLPKEEGAVKGFAKDMAYNAADAAIRIIKFID